MLTLTYLKWNIRSFQISRRSVIFSFVLLLLTGLNLTATATIKTQDWLESHRGYSIEQVPGTGNGSPIEYVAAGTAYTAGGVGSQPGWHFMRLDENGNILASRISFSAPPPNTLPIDEFRVVDITVESSTKYWITIQGRRFLPPVRNFIYIAGVDQNGNDLPTNPAIEIRRSGQTGHNNLYPTHSLFMGGALYICGYAADLNFTDEPLDNSDKVGMFAKVDVNGTPVTSTFYFWGTTNNVNNDFDMALRISPSIGSGYEPDFPLLVAGSANGDGYSSMGLVLKFDNNVNLLDAGTFLPLPYAVSWDPPKTAGLYAVDVRGPIPSEPGNEEESGGYVVLVNYFDYDVPSQRNWGIIRLKNDLSTWDQFYNFSALYVGNKSWANSFTCLTYTDLAPTSSVGVVGHQYEVNTIGEEDCDELEDGAVIDLNNPCPFEAGLVVTGTPYWNATTGYGAYNMAGFLGNKIHYSLEGSITTDMVYRVGSLGLGRYLEDVTRLYTFGSVSRYYYGSGASTFPDFTAFIAPIGESALSSPASPYLRTKFIQTDINTESVCEKYYDDCLHIGSSQVIGNLGVVTEDNEGINMESTYYDLANNWYIPNNIDCTTGFYKPGRLSIANYIQDSHASIYPNPASAELNIQLPQALQENDILKFILLDITGKKVFEAENKIQMKLPTLVPGIYIGTVEYNGTKHSEKIIIE